MAALWPATIHSLLHIFNNPSNMELILLYIPQQSFLNGHGTSIGGVLVGKDIELMKTKVAKTAKTLGGNSNPFDAFLLVNGMKTLEVRMERHCHNAMVNSSLPRTPCCCCQGKL
jgi:O-acetylhomoserine/O-acetylserine sulfhydrylase-like pyridoxal-dependent enzyme